MRTAHILYAGYGLLRIIAAYSQELKMAMSIRFNNLKDLLNDMRSKNRIIEAFPLIIIKGNTPLF